jgi:RNA polymerase sigma-70 factor (ECF subfamily)
MTRALEVWPRRGIPDNPAAWLTTTARNRAIDRLRRRRNLERKQEEMTVLARLEAEAEESDHDPNIADERLRLIFTCCHPALPEEGRVALALKTLGGLRTGEVARAFLVSETTMYQRIVRAKRKIRAAGIPFEVPRPEDLPARLDSVLAVVYLIFNEGHLASTGDDLDRPDLAKEAIRLAELLVSLMPDEPEAVGLLALLLSSEARRAARSDSAGDVVLLEDQDRSRWDRSMIDRGAGLVERALRMGHPGPYQI